MSDDGWLYASVSDTFIASDDQGGGGGWGVSQSEPVHPDWAWKCLEVRWPLAPLRGETEGLSKQAH